jgi:hypothetical protein
MSELRKGNRVEIKQQVSGSFDSRALSKPLLFGFCCFMRLPWPQETSSFLPVMQKPATDCAPSIVNGKKRKGNGRVDCLAGCLFELPDSA